MTALLRTRSFGTRLQAGAASAAAVAITSFAAGGTDFDTFVSESGRNRIARLAGTGPARRCRRLGAVKAGPVELVEHGVVEAFADRVVVRGAGRDPVMDQSGLPIEALATRLCLIGSRRLVGCGGRNQGDNSDRPAYSALPPLGAILCDNSILPGYCG